MMYVSNVLSEDMERRSVVNAGLPHTQERHIAWIRDLLIIFVLSAIKSMTSLSVNNGGQRGAYFIRRRGTVLEYIKNLSISNSLVLYLTDESIEINVRYNKIKINFVISVIGKENLKGWFWFDIWPFRIVCQVLLNCCFSSTTSISFSSSRTHIHVFKVEGERSKPENIVEFFFGEFLWLIKFYGFA